MYKAIKTKIAALLMVILTVVGIGSQAISARAATEVEAAEKTASWQKKGTYEVRLEVPGADGDNLHDEIIVMIDGSYSMDEEWEDMKKTIIEIGKSVLNGTGNTQLTLMSFGISPNVVLEHVTSVDELKRSLPEKPGGLLYGRSATNCDGAFEGIKAYIEKHDETLSDVNVIFLSDGGANLNSTPEDWIACSNKLDISLAHDLQGREWSGVVSGEYEISDASKLVYGDGLKELLEKWDTVLEKEISLGQLDAQIDELKTQMTEMNIDSEEYALAEDKLADLQKEFDDELAASNEAYGVVSAAWNEKDENGKTASQRWVAQVYKDFYEFAGLTEGEKYPVYVAEYAYVDYQNAKNFCLNHTFYYVLGSCSGVNHDKVNNVKGYYALESATETASMEEIDKMWLVRWGDDDRSDWMEQVENTEFVQSNSISTLITALEGVLGELSKTPFNDVVVTDYMSKWVNLDVDSLKIVDNSTGEVIWTKTGGWAITENIPTTAEPPVVVTKVEPADYEAGGNNVIGNTNGDIYKLTWTVKDGALLLADSYALVYNVTVDTEEEGFQYDESYPANGNTYMDYTDEKGERQKEDIDVPNVTDMERILHIYKYNPVGENDPEGDGTAVDINADTHTPLANVSFSIYKVCALKDLENINGEVPAVVLGEEPTEADVATYGTIENYITTVTTDALGHAMYTFGDAGSDGVYLVVEEPNPAIAVATKPFFVSLPMTNPTQDGWLYTVYVYPKNDLEPAPEIDKDVTKVGNDYGTFDVNDRFTYIIRGEIPAGLATAEEYALSDTLDTRLDYEGNVIVKLYNEDKKELALIKDKHYTLTETAASGEKGAFLKMELTKAGMEYVMENLGDDVENVEPEIRVYFDASLNATVQMGTKIQNNATIDYTNSTGYKYIPNEVPENKRPEVETGGTNILKYNAADESDYLTGAQFMIARSASDGDAAEDIKKLVVNGMTKDVVYVDFYATEAMDGEKVNVAITDENGEAVIYGLAYGEYYLVEIKAPTGYNLLKKPVTVTIDSDSHTDTETIRVANSNKFQLPETGGIGTTIFTASGIMMLAGAAVVLIMKKKEEEE